MLTEMARPDQAFHQTLQLGAGAASENLQRVHIDPLLEAVAVQVVSYTFGQEQRKIKTHRIVPRQQDHRRLGHKTRHSFLVVGI